MIDLRLVVEPPPLDMPTIVRLRDRMSADIGPHDAVLIDRDGDRREYDFAGFSLTVHAHQTLDLDNDVLLLAPGRSSAPRLIRARSKHNTFLVTEQCDQLCVMCSQPPKKHHSDLFDQFETAALLAPRDAYLGISGGEPLLHKQKLFQMLLNVTAARPDLKFHILSNGQFLDRSDLSALIEIGISRVLWGIPLYSSIASEHDEIVGKRGAFERLEQSFAILMRAGSAVELRTVVMRQNWSSLHDLAEYVTTRLPFLDRWALMQLENIGYGRMNWKSSFIDTSCEFSSLGRAIDIAQARGTTVSLYNFPLCSLPPSYRGLAPPTISDWKTKHESFCDGCSGRDDCGGFFEWYDHRQGFKRVGVL